MSDVAQAQDHQQRSRSKHPVRLERANGVATILIDNPPVNALSAAVRQGIYISIEAAEADPKTKAIVIAANGRTFPAGADITEFGSEPKDPSLPVLCDRVERCPKPVFAALHGTVLGGGLELAMAAHYRIAAPTAKLGLPEVKLGFPPGAGGTQRLPRLIGVEHALAMIQSGASISAQEALANTLVDAVDDDPRDAATSLALTDMSARPTSKDRSRLKDAPGDLALLSAAREVLPEMGGPQPAMERIIDCLEAAILLPFEVGLTRERDAFKECLASRDSHAMRHLFFAERRAAKFPELDGRKGAVPRHVAIVGGGLMGSGIAIACLNSGLPVTVIEDGEAGVTAALDRIGDGVQKAVAKGRISEAQGAQALTRLTLTARMSEINKANFIIETVSEDLKIKRPVLAEIGKAAAPEAVIATNTSYLDLEELAQASGRPDRFVGMHFFAPAHIMRLVEIAVGPDTNSDAVALAHRIAKGLGKIPVRTGTGPGFIVNRILTRMRLVADAMVEDGAVPAQIDTAMRNFGFALGPYQVLDRSGLDISWEMRKRRGPVEGERYVAIGDKMCELGWLGQKSGQGYYIYPADGAPEPNPDALLLIEELRRAKNIDPRQFTDREIRDRLLLAMVNEGARLVETGDAQRPSDVDVAMIYGLGYPERRGGPMFDADQTTPFEIHRRIGRLALEEPDLWQIAPLLERLARERGKFSDLN